MSEVPVKTWMALALAVPVKPVTIGQRLQTLILLVSSALELQLGDLFLKIAHLLVAVLPCLEFGCLPASAPFPACLRISVAGFSSRPCLLQWLVPHSNRNH